MLIRAIRVFTIILMCACLIVGSFVEDNFGLTQTRTNIESSGVLSSIDPYPSTDIRSKFGELFIINYPQPAESFRQEEIKLPFPPETIAIILTTLFALVLLRSHFMPGKREHIPSVAAYEGLYPSWKVPFKKYKYHYSDAILPKRHPKYHSRSA
jgi:hypothetical protein